MNRAGHQHPRLRQAPLVVVVIALSLASCEDSSGSWSLYRHNAAAGPGGVRVADFDSPRGERFNARNCQDAADALGAQPGVQTIYWCEPSSGREVCIEDRAHS